MSDMIDPTEQTLAGRQVLLGVSGGIAAYKSADLVRRLTERGAQVRVVMTPGATAFVTPLTFQAVSGHPVHTELLDDAAEAGMGHIELARWADIVLIAPASADLMARLAAGLANDLLSTVCLATSAPLVVAPAMNSVMWSHPATRANAATLEERGARLLGPADGQQACGETGPGRMLEPSMIADALGDQLARSDALTGTHVVVTAGPTYEDIDPVRYLGNRSSGKMGFALAGAARALGADVTLIAGPVRLSTPPAVRRIDVRSAEQMRAAVMAAVDTDQPTIFISAAAVADFRPRVVAEQKIKKHQLDTMTIELEPNRDILTEVAGLDHGPFCVGFAAETDAVTEHARDKLQRKRLDMICANQVGGPDSGFDTDNNAVTAIWNGGQQVFDNTTKRRLAQQLLELIAQRWQDHKVAWQKNSWNEKSA